MFGAISGALAAVYGRQAGRYAALKKEYREQIALEFSRAFSDIVHSNLKDLKADLQSVMNIQKVEGEIIDEDILGVKLKEKTANHIISDTRVKIDEELHKLYSQLSS